MAGVATAIGAAAVIGAGAAVYSSSQQAGAAKNAQNISQNQYANTVALESPYNQAGLGALSQLNYLEGTGTAGQGQTAASSNAGGFGSLNTPFNTDTFHSMSPAYQFNMQQGQQGVLNGATSNMGALSGAAQKDLIGYSQNNANNSYNNAFNQYQTQQGNVYSRLSNLANLGQSAASNTAQQGTALAGQAAQSAQNVGNAYASGANGVGTAANNYAQNSMLSSYMNQNAGYGTMTPSNASSAGGTTSGAAYNSLYG